MIFGALMLFIYFIIYDTVRFLFRELWNPSLSHHSVSKQINKFTAILLFSLSIVFEKQPQEESAQYVFVLRN